MTLDDGGDLCGYTFCVQSLRGVSSVVIKVEIEIDTANIGTELLLVTKNRGQLAQLSPKLSRKMKKI